jgi:hypothetical protein
VSESKNISVVVSMRMLTRRPLWISAASSRCEPRETRPLGETMRSFQDGAGLGRGQQ